MLLVSNSIKAPFYSKSLLNKYIYVRIISKDYKVSRIEDLKKLHPMATKLNFISWILSTFKNV